MLGNQELKITHDSNELEQGETEQKVETFYLYFAETDNCDEIFKGIHLISQPSLFQ